ncbi:ImmA/IrrE family metallo-endopeptidase [Kytococcus sedentarius]|uniref:Uncharacterized protein n=1 Tax=Kytococcus sedentarius (strain ATCC 14392 / DSM 20547 / JCM 11482 / CCUG 33030 / NBRC 15357 / NCTC 11040 / CCM 314 / 541) TaxID=478801 RepID=C7NLQ3_KYTSD|nr:protein of unknown function (DUF955) [Kytococcus sedentarius DSM 20547]QQB64135.1 ImmA/IrrE family metallo-endopeptidase [Kytococcus sedentarius]STX12867.1 Domain of uncharacterised function (DUF955) [Kytococcus sedentarius]
MPLHHSTGLDPRFRSRSFNNTLLIWVAHEEAFEQGRVPKPFPSYVAGYKQWQALGRQVEKGQPGYQILAPVTGRFASANPADAESWRRLGKGEKPRAGEVVRSKMVGVRPAMIHGANGVTDYTARTVAVRENMDPAAQVKTLAHELGHVLLHGPDSDEARQHRGIGEVEAESVALIFGAAHGMDTSGYTIPYVSTWAARVDGKEPGEIVKATGERVRKTALSILDRLDTAQVADGAPPGLDRDAPQREEHSRTQPTHDALAPGRVTPLPEPEPRTVTASATTQARAL